MIALILIIVALVCFAFAAFGVLASRINLVAAGLFCWLLAVELLPHLHVS